MKAVSLKSPGNVEVEDYLRPNLNSGDILVEMKVCGLCGTDLEKLRGGYVASMPRLGHEPVGIISKIGHNVKGLDVGDRVFVHHHVPCYDCYYCNRGSETMCAKYRSTNIDPCGFAEYFRVPAWNVERGGVQKLSDTISWEEGSFIEPTACCIRGLNRLGNSKIDSALIVGAGPMGLTFLQLLQLHGTANLFISEFNKIRRNLTQTQYKCTSLDPLNDDISLKIKSQTDQRGVDLAVIASGNSSAIIQGLNSVRRGGNVLLFGLPSVGTLLNYDASILLNREINLIASNAATEDDVNKAMSYISEHRINVSSMITHRFKIEDFNKAIEITENSECIKVIITP